jgi:hypothetical protein
MIKKLEKCFYKSIYRILKIKISHLDIKSQFKELKKYKILLIFYRQFSYNVCFLYRIMSRKNTLLFQRINKFLKSDQNYRSCTRNTYIRPTFQDKIFKFSFSTISTQTLNFIQNKFSEHNSLRLKKNKKQINIKTYLLENIEFFMINFILLLLNFSNLGPDP